MTKIVAEKMVAKQDLQEMELRLTLITAAVAVLLRLW